MAINLNDALNAQLEEVVEKMIEAKKALQEANMGAHSMSEYLGTGSGRDLAIKNVAKDIIECLNLVNAGVQKAEHLQDQIKHRKLASSPMDRIASLEARIASLQSQLNRR